MRYSILKVLVILPFIFFTSCVSNKKIVDVDGPEFLFYSFCGTRVLFQFDEPVTAAFFYVKEQEVYSVANDFPAANLYIDETVFLGRPGELTICVKDSSGNDARWPVKDFKVNPGTAQLKIEEVRLVYSNKRCQYIAFSVVKGGSLLGYTLTLYLRGKKKLVNFAGQTVKAGQKIIFYIKLDEEAAPEEPELAVSADPGDLVLKHRLPQSASCFMLRNYRGELDDYFLYYNSKNKSLEEYLSSNYYKHLVQEVTKSIVNPLWFDIKGTTSLKVISRSGGKFSIVSKK